MMRLIINCHKLSNEALDKDVDLDDILSVKVRESIGRSKYIKESEEEKFDAIDRDMRSEIGSLVSEGE